MFYKKVIQSLIMIVLWVHVAVACEEYSSASSVISQKKCESKELHQLLNKAENHTELNDLEEALQIYREAYAICPMKNIEEQMAWLLSEVDDEEKSGRYINERFHFMLVYPEEIFVEKLLSDNGDGITLYNQDKTLELKAYGSLYGENIKEIYHDTLKWSAEAKEHVTYKVLRKNWFVFSGMTFENKRIFYQKTFYKKSGSVSVKLVYPAKNAKRYDKLLRDIMKNFRY